MRDSSVAGQRLAAYLAVRDDADAERELGDLLEQHAAPLLRRIVSHRLSGMASDLDDVCSQVMLQLMVRLRRMRTEADAGAMEVFASYVAVAAHHGCDHHIRARYPLRWRLRNRLRHVLEHDPRFAVWKANDVWTCGLAAWRGRAADLDTQPAVQLSDVPVDDADQLLRRLFPATGTPLELTRVVDAAAVAWGIPLFHRDEAAQLGHVVDREPRMDQRLDQRSRLGAVWAEVRELPQRQRHALLLNLRDDAITLFLTHGVATMAEIAGTLELTLGAFAALWNDLPLPDNTIAERLSCTRQQVINLRMAARKRLANRLAAKANMRDGSAL